MDLAHRRSAGCDERGIDLVVLGSLQVECGIGPDLCRLEYHNHKPLAAQLGDDRLFVTAAGFDPHAFDAVLSQPRQQNLVTFRRVVYLQLLLAAAVERYVELPLTGINPGTNYGTLGHLRRSLPCDANLEFVQPFGSR